MWDIIFDNYTGFWERGKMEPVTQIILSFLGIIGVGGIITAHINKIKEIEFHKLEAKQKRYKSTIVFMEKYFDPEEIKYLQNPQRKLGNNENIVDILKFEYNEMVLFASKGVLCAMKRFIEMPNRDNFLNVLLAMRKDLWIKKKDLNLSDIRLN